MPFIDLTGQTFNRLTVIRHVGKNKFRQPCCECRCLCGNITITAIRYLKTGHTKSCGCLQKERARSCKLIHGMAHTPEYKIWAGIIYRCVNQNNPRFKDYGGRGINICSEWRHDFMSFFNYVGKRPSKKHSIDRINNNGNYEPGNVKWSLPQEQNNNSRQNRHITINGHTKTMTQWARLVGIKKRTLFSRLKANWPPAKAIFTPVRHR